MIVLRGAKVVDGSGAPGEALFEPLNRRTGYWFGFVCVPTEFPAPGAGSRRSLFDTTPSTLPK
jgi:hypothetical protein